MLKKKYTPEELAKAREEAERKARRGEIEPTHDFTFTLIGQARHADFLFLDGTPASICPRTLKIYIFRILLILIISCSFREN